MPEFLTEANWENDFRSTKEWVIGVPNGSSATISATNTGSAAFSAIAITDYRHQEFKTRIGKLIKRSHKNGAIDSPTVVFCDTNEAEMLKLMKNCFLSAKVSIMNEFYDFCQATNTDYANVSALAKRDVRMGTSHFQVPGPDGRRGFGGTCFPKDTHSLYCQMNAHGVRTQVYPAILTRNDTYDRPEREWSRDIWRTTIPLPSATSKVIVVFNDGGSGSASAYLTNIIRTNLANNNVVIQVVRDVNDTKSVSFPAHKNHFIKYQTDPGIPLFFPRVDECYYSPHISDTTYDIMHCVLNIIDLWNSHEEMILYVIKSRVEDNDYSTATTDESGTEGFESDESSSDVAKCYPCIFDYAKMIEEYYHSKLAHQPNQRRYLIVLF
jgi:hypothetical protein